MTNKQPFPERKNIRWDKQDYSAPGEYMVTICVRDMKQILSRVVIDDNQKRAHHDTPLQVSNNRNVSNNREKYTENYTVSSVEKQNNSFYRTNGDNVGAIHESPAKQTKPTAKIILTPFGEIVDNVIKNIPSHLGVEIVKYVIMPNHIHLLIEIPCHENWQGDAPATEGRSKISKTVGYIKMNSSKRIREKFNFTNIWQRSFHDHVIRDENDFIGAINYIENNPYRWIEE